MNSWTSKPLMPRPVRLAFRVKRPACSTILNVVIAAVALLIFGATFRAGIDRGMDRLVSMEGYGRILSAIAAVMTEQRFRQGGYALSNCIHNELERRGFTADPEIVKRAGATVPQNLPAHFLDKLLEDMQRDLPKLADYCGTAIRGRGGDDVGYVDFAKIAFFLFGLHIRAFDYLFFLVYGSPQVAYRRALLERLHWPPSRSTEKSWPHFRPSAGTVAPSVAPARS